ncbi:synaptotagmin 56 [Daphnia pulex]|uniref:Synaptotagmin 56 n=1 Tax=Daphnia pulex TaxID=6669 RepID=E9HKD2_DAPPU|nr:synaptotagmin 56 [Daphnia pulex]|eukprot:EFX67801.1 synaptotagmin 56 [Daphnia pulex]
MESPAYSFDESISNRTSSTKCFVNWLLFSDRLEIADCFGYSFFLDFRVSNLFLAAFVVVCCFFVFLMLTSMCCLFFWLQRKKANNRKMLNKSNFIVKQKSTGIHSKTPVIRSEDIISFVLPAVRKQKNSLMAVARQSKDVVETNTFKTAPPTPGTVGYCRGNNNLDPSNLNLKLYSPGQETNENVNICRAKIGFSIQKDSSRQLLILKILGALNLPARSKNIPPDPYVKIIVLPERQIKCVTKTVKSNHNPLFNQIFELDMSGLNMNETEILLAVRDRPEVSRYERCVSRSVTLGQAIFCVAEFDDGNDHRRQVRWCLLEISPSISPRADATNAQRCSKGEMLISLLYQPHLGRMILELLQIRPMPVLVSNNQDKEKVTIKVLLYERGYLTSSRRTNSIRRDEATAVVREKFVFALQPHMLHEASCQLVLVTKSTIGTKRTLGRITLGHRHFFSTWANSTGLTTGIDHWHDMAHRPGVSIERWHPIL